MNNGNYDNIHDCKYRIPDYWDIGEVYERLIEDCLVMMRYFMVYGKCIIRG